MEDIGKSFPAAEGMIEAEQGSQKKQNNEFCLNCGTKLLDNFCHHCGQKDLPKRQTMGELIENFIGSFYSFESKFFKTFRYLLFKPGFLPKEYTAGKRETYYHPARAYVFISFIFFLLLFSLPDDEGNILENTIEEKSGVKTDALSEMKQDLQKEGIDSTLVNNSAADSVITYSFDSDDNKQKKRRSGAISLSNSEYKTIEEYDSVQAALPESKRDGWFIRKLTIKGIELNQRYKDDEGISRFGDDFGQAFLDNFSKVLFYLLPLFALILKLLYVRRDFYYSEHLVFAIYYYNFFYLAATIFLLFDLIPGVGGLLNKILVIWMIAYLPIGMKRMYEQSWRKTLFKFGIFSFIFMILLVLGITGSMLFILMNL
jgi:hypothetical protein